MRAQAQGGFAVGAGIDLPLRSVGPAYGSPLPPWQVQVALSHALDLSPTKVVTRTVTAGNRWVQFVALDSGPEPAAGAKGERDALPPRQP